MNCKGSIGSVLHGKVFASFNGRFVKDYETTEVQYMFPYFFDKLCIIAPSATKVPGWMAIFKCFSAHVWLIILFVNGLCGIFWFWFKRFNIKHL